MAQLEEVLNSLQHQINVNRMVSAVIVSLITEQLEATDPSIRSKLLLNLDALQGRTKETAFTGEALIAVRAMIS